MSSIVLGSPKRLPKRLYSVDEPRIQSMFSQCDLDITRSNAQSVGIHLSDSELECMVAMIAKFASYIPALAPPLVVADTVAQNMTHAIGKLHPTTRANNQPFTAISVAMMLTVHDLHPLASSVVSSFDAIVQLIADSGLTFEFVAGMRFPPARVRDAMAAAIARYDTMAIQRLLQTMSASTKQTDMRIISGLRNEVDI